MALPVVFNATHVMGLALPAGVLVSSGDLLSEHGRLADSTSDLDGNIRSPAAFISMKTDQTGLGATISVCRACVLYDSDAPFTSRELFLGEDGAIAIKPGFPSQRVGAGLTPYYASVSLQPDAAVVSSTDLADLHDLLFLVTDNPEAFGGIGEMLQVLRDART